MRFDARVGADGIAWFGAARAEPLHGPSNLLAVHPSEVARACGCEDSRGARLMECGRAVKDGRIAALRAHNVEPCFVGGARAQQIVAEDGPVFGRWRLACE